MAQNNANKIVNAINEVVEVNQNDVKIAPAGAPANLNAPPGYHQSNTLKAPVQPQVQTQVTQVPQVAQVQAPMQVQPQVQPQMMQMQPQVQQMPMMQQQMPMMQHQMQMVPQVMQQPIIQPIMQQPIVHQAAPAPIIINNGNVLKTNYHFSNEMCGCCSNPGLCLLSLFCPCVPVGQAAEAADCGNCMVCAIACLCFPPVACCVRGAVRRKRNIVGDCCSDACAVFCCQVCAISQMARESGAYQMGEKIEKAEEAKEDNVFMISQSISRE